MGQGAGADRRTVPRLAGGGRGPGIANKTSGRLPRGTGSLAGRFFALLGNPNDTDVGPVCNDADGNALAGTFGLGHFTNGYGIDGTTGRHDLGSAKFLLLLGTNWAPAAVYRSQRPPADDGPGGGGRTHRPCGRGSAAERAFRHPTRDAR